MNLLAGRILTYIESTRCFPKDRPNWLAMRYLSLLPCLVLASAVSAIAGDVTMFRGDPAHTGMSASRAPQQLHLRWTFDPTAGTGQTAEPIYSSPVAANGLVYIGSNDNNLYALDAATGKKKWQFKTTGGPFKGGGNVASTPAVADNFVYFTCADGNFYALDALTGELRWTFATEGERRFTKPGVNYTQPMTETMPDLWDFFLSSPTVVDGAVYFGSGDGCIYSLDAKTGTLRWKYKTGDVVHASPAVAGGVVYVGSYDSYFYALNAADGKLRWRFKTGDDPVSYNQTGIPGSAVVAGDSVYFGCRDANLYALEAATGKLRWKFPNNQSWVIASPVVVGDVLYYVTSDSLKFEALDAATGKELYSLPNGTYAFSSPTIAGGKAYFGTFGGVLYAVELTQRRFENTFATPGHRSNKEKFLTEAGQLKPDLWVGETLEDAVMALRTKLFTLGSILSTPCVHDGVVYFASVDGKVYAIGE
jgi:outer membrane protein assembly factor BamB